MGSCAFPFGSAGTARMTQIALLFKKQNFEIKVINRFSSHSKNIADSNISVSGVYKSIPYTCCSLINYRPHNFLKRNFFKAVGAFVELTLITYYIFFKKIKFALVYTTKLKSLKYYSKLLRAFDVKIIYDYNEYVDSLANRNESNITLINGNFDHNFHNYIDACIIISPFLEKQFTEIQNKKPYCMLPPGLDFNSQIKDFETNQNFFLYCGGVAYFNTIIFMIDAYSKLSSFSFKLKIITFGSHEKIHQLKEHIIKLGLDSHIEVFSKLDYELLLSYYKSAKALLLPLTNNLQDCARFPFKLCEYTSSKTLIISSKTQLMETYFNDHESALLAGVNDSADFTKKLEFVINNPELSKKIGLRGYAVGQKYFDLNNQNISLNLGEI